MVSTTPKYSPVRNFNRHMIEVDAGDAWQPASASVMDRRLNRRVLVQDDAFRRTKSVIKEHDLTVENVAGIKKASPFGFSPYHIPKIDVKPKTLHFATGKFKEKCFTDLEANAFKWVPPAKYCPHTDWKTQFPNRGKFGKYEKRTFTSDVFKSEQKKTGPHHYTTFDQRKNRTVGAFNL